MKKTTTLAILLFLFAFSLFAQQERNCASMENLEYRKQNDPNLESKMAQIEAFTRNKIEQDQASQNKIVGNIITIPVVVHVIYSNAQENISEAQILSQIQVLNDDFRRLNTDADNTWSQAADTQIEFCMATVDPNGNATNGITRKSSTKSSWGTNDAMKKSSQGGVNPWNTAEYLNMWVCNIGGGILGYAQFPGGSAATDGVVMGPNYFGSKNLGSGFYLSAPFDEGRTTTHEVGHFLNLRHIWGDSNCGNDFVSDTPTHQTSNGGCPVGKTSCGSVDMVQNYMDYTNDSCMNLFTQGQKSRMRAVLAAGGARRALALSDKCGATTQPTCSDGIQNGNETGVDCGGSCTPCQTACNDNEINVVITFDNYPEETAWTLKNANGSTVASGTYSSANADGSTVNESYCLPDGCYDFEITDVYGDGICCSYGNGSYTVTNGSTTLASGGTFTGSDTTNFCLGGVVDTEKPVISLNGNATINLTVGDTYNELGATATDNIDGNLTSSIVITGTVNTSTAGTYTRNYNVSDAAGNAANQVSRTIIVSSASGSGCSGAITSFPYSESFESNFGDWTQGNGDDFNWARRSGSTPSSNTGPSSASNGSQYVYMESSAPNYSSKRAILISPCYNLTGLNQATFSFKYHMYGTAAMGSLKLEISTNNGTSWTSLWTRSGNQGNSWRDASVDLSTYADSNVQLRFDGTTGTTWQGDMAVDAVSLTNGAADKCAGVSPYVSGQSYAVGQQVTYNGYLYQRTASGWNNLGACGTAREELQGSVSHLGVAITIYPNPVKGNMLYVKSTMEDLPFTIVNMLGQQVAKGTSAHGVNVGNLEAGLYMIQFKVNSTIETRKFIKE